MRLCRTPQLLPAVSIVGWIRQYDDVKAAPKSSFRSADVASEIGCTEQEAAVALEELLEAGGVGYIDGSTSYFTKGVLLSCTGLLNLW